MSPFGLPHWDFEKREAVQGSLEIMEQVRRHFIWMAPPCTKWSTIQRLNMRDDAKKQ